jgi:L-threonylcarbamoyladenylate synthase
MICRSSLTQTLFHLKIVSNMKTDTVRLRIDATSPNPETIDRAARVLRDGGFVVGPTETRYGLLARADSPDAVRRLFALKGRSRTSPIAVFVKDVAAARKLGEFTEAAEQIAERFLPGPVTLVVKARPDAPESIVTDGKIGLRVSSAPTVQALIAKSGLLLTATSANRSGLAEHEDVSQISYVFGDAVGAYLDAGPLTRPVSTVVDCTATPVRILRAGAVRQPDIAAVTKIEVTND